MYRGVNLFPVQKDLLLDKLKYATITRAELKVLKKILSKEFHFLEKERPALALVVLGVLTLCDIALEQTNGRRNEKKWNWTNLLMRYLGTLRNMFR